MSSHNLKTSTTTLHIIDLPGGGVMVYTTAGTPLPGQRLTPGQALATDLLSQCTHRASDVRYWHGVDRAMELTRSLLDPEQFGYAVTAEVHRAARRVLGLPTFGIPTGDVAADDASTEGATT